MNIDEITTGTINSPADLIDLQESMLSPQSNVVPTRWAFRGQSQPFGNLVPSIQRIFGQKRSSRTAEIIESDLIVTFREHYAKLDGRTSDMPDPYMISENYDLRCLSVMQHYGVPTRLLDWTSNFWTAVYFACAGDPSKDAELWFYDRDIFFDQRSSPELSTLLKSIYRNQISPPLEPLLLKQRGRNLIVELDPQMTPRMKTQFAHHTLSTDIFSDHALMLFDLSEKLPPKPDDSKYTFRRVLISSGCKEKALRFLADQEKITAGTIFPDVEGLGKFLHWHLESLVTTLL